MVSFDQLQTYMRKSAEEDRNRQYVNVSGETLQDALREAAVELSLPIKKIEYEILENGSSGVLGVGKKPYLILAYPAIQQVSSESFEERFDMDLGFDDESRPRDRDGQAYVKLSPNGVLLKVSPPQGSGVRATERDAIEALSKRSIEKFDAGLVKKVVQLADDEFVKVAQYDYNPANDAYMSVDFAEAEMKAYLNLSPPGEGGADPTADGIRVFLESNDVVHGIKEEVLNRLDEQPIYREPVLVAEGTRPKNGADAKIQYNFEIEPGKIHVKEVEGRVDFKELNRVQNVVEGQVLAKRIPAEQGEPGYTVTGKLLPARDGKNVPIPIGQNVRLSEDGSTAFAEINGLVRIQSGKINVEPVYVVEGDVNMKEGNIKFLGTVVVKGNVDDGFDVSAAGHIEVMGSVGRCNLSAEGDIIVHQGITGKNSGRIICSGSLWSKFIENAHVEAGELVVVSDGIINSTVFSDKRIVCRGKRASIVGGHLRASEEIDAKALGSVAGMETLLEVGYDPKQKERLVELEEQDAELGKQLDEIGLNMSTIEKMRKAKKQIPKEKLKAYALLKQKREKIKSRREKIRDEIEQIQNYLDQLKINGRISASGTVFPGVKVRIKEAPLDVRNEFHSVTFVAEGGTVSVTKYEESDADISVRRRE
ncbi:MAG: FapA family protein [Alkalispirochaetaceae bacterium]